MIVGSFGRYLAETVHDHESRCVLHTSNPTSPARGAQV